MGDALRWEVFWAETLPGRDDVIGALEGGGCAVIPGRPFTEAARIFSETELIDVLREVDAVMVGSRERWTRRVFEACPRLQTVAKLGIGVERIDVRVATELGILVSNTPVPGATTPEPKCSKTLLMSEIMFPRASEAAR